MILGVRSMFFRNIFTALNNEKPIIYLDNIKVFHLKHILEFIYVGECKIEHKYLDELLIIGRRLEIKSFNESYHNQEEVEPIKNEDRVSICDSKSVKDDPELTQLLSVDPEIKSENIVEEVRSNKTRGLR